VKSILYIAIYVAVLGVASVYLLLSYWYVWIAIVIAGLVILVSLHANATVYCCPKCDYKFEISMFTDFLTPHGVDRNGVWMYLTCPRCSNRSKMRILVKTEDKK
jgi:hypothetical protein